MSKKKIVIITDCIDVAFHEAYRIIEDQLEKYEISDFKIYPIVSVKSFSIINAAFILRLLAEIHGTDSYFLVIVSSGKDASDRIFGKTKTGVTFVGNNSGYLGWMLEDMGVECVYLNKVSKSNNYQSYGGKYVQAPTLAKLVAGVPFEELGEALDNSFINYFGICPGTVVHCDNFGLMKIKGCLPDNVSEGQELILKINNKRILKAVYSRNMKFQTTGTWVIYKGSSLWGLPELGRVRCLNSAGELGVQEGDIIKWD